MVWFRKKRKAADLARRPVRKVLGIRHGHDAAAAMIVDGNIVADAAEERFSRVKNDTSYPEKAVEFCLKQSGVASDEIDAVAFPSERVLPPPFLAFFDVPDDVQRPSSNAAKPPTLPLYKEPLPLSSGCCLVMVPHHMAHAASAYFTSGLGDERALIVTMDGVGEGVSTAVWRAEGNRIEPVKLWDSRASMGWFYACATEALGWRHGSDEWKTMGLAPYGVAQPGALQGFHPEFVDGELVVPHDYGEASRWPDHGANHYHMRDAAPLRLLVDKLGRENFAAEAQRVVEEQCLDFVLSWLRKEETRHLCAAGGCFLNVKLNQKLWYSHALDTQWVYPNPADAGLAAGAALHVYFEQNREQGHARLQDIYQGPEYGAGEIRDILDERGLEYEEHHDIAQAAAEHLARNRIVGWFQGRMESGPRALGNRSILMSPLKAENKDIINARVKFREPFRPFCPSILSEKAAEYLVDHREEAFMVTSFDVRKEKQGRIPAVVHVDGTARPQMVRREVNPRYYDLIKAFGELTGEYVILNTSLNVRGEPIVCSPREAIRCFFDNGIDVLVLDRFLIKKPVLRTADGDSGSANLT